MFKASAILSLVFIALMLCGCQKARLNRETVSTEDFLEQQFIWNDIFRISLNAALIAEEDSNIVWDGCASISKDTLGEPYPISTTIDFGLSNCRGADGRLRRGRLLILRTTPLEQINATLNVTAETYFLNNKGVEGEINIKYIGDRDSLPAFEVDIVDGQIADGNEPITVLGGNMIFKMIGGKETTFFSENLDGILAEDALLDDMYQISSLVADGINSDGRAYNVNTDLELRFDLGCGYITEGALQLKPEALDTRKITFGNGNCDAEVSVEIESGIEGVIIKG